MYIPVVSAKVMSRSSEQAITATPRRKKRTPAVKKLKMDGKMPCEEGYLFLPAVSWGTLK